MIVNPIFVTLNISKTKTEENAKTENATTINKLDPLNISYLSSVDIPRIIAIKDISKFDIKPFCPKKLSV